MEAIYNGSNSFRVFDNRTGEFVAARRVKMDCGLDGIKYASVVSSSYSAPYTTVEMDESDLTAALTDVWYGVVQAGSMGSMPDHLHDGSEGSGGEITVSGGGGATTFLELTDTPNTYSGTEGQYSISTGSGTVWATVSGLDGADGAPGVDGNDAPTTFSGLTDTPDTYDDGKYLRSTASGTEWATVSGGGGGSSDVQTFLDLTDTPSSYSGTSDQVLVSTGSGIDFIDMNYTVKTYLTLSGGGMSDSQNSGFDSSNLVDGNISGGSFYEGDGGFDYWVKYDFGPDNSQVITHYKLWAGTSEPGRMPKTWQLQGSNDDIDFSNVVDSQSNETGWTIYESREYTFINDVEYRYYRMWFNEGNHATYLRLFEWDLGVTNIVGNVEHSHDAYVPWNFGAGTISGTGDIYCNDIYTSSGTVWIGDLKLSTDGQNLLVDDAPVEGDTSGIPIFTATSGAPETSAIKAGDLHLNLVNNDFSQTINTGDFRSSTKYNNTEMTHTCSNYVRRWWYIYSKCRYY